MVFVLSVVLLCCSSFFFKINSHYVTLAILVPKVKCSLASKWTHRYPTTSASWVLGLNFSHICLILRENSEHISGYILLINYPTWLSLTEINGLLKILLKKSLNINYLLKCILWLPVIITCFICQEEFIIHIFI